MRLFYLMFGAVAAAFLMFIILGDVKFSSGRVVLGDWAKNQIKEELSPFEGSKFSRNDVDLEYKRLSQHPSNSILRFQISGGKLYSNYAEIDPNDSRLIEAHDEYSKFFAKLIQKHEFNESVDFLISVDRLFLSGEDSHLTVPVFVPMKKNSDYSGMVLAPDMYLISEWNTLYHDIKAANDRYPWDRKIDKAFWRGSGYTGKDASSDIPRISLVELSGVNPSIIDARFTKFITRAGASKDLASKFPIAMVVSQSDHVKYKAQIYVEGNVSSVSADLWRLLSNTVTLKESSGFVRWYDPLLKEGEHYLSIRGDMSDLLEKMNWILKHDSEAKKIADISTRLVADEITPDHLYLYWKHLLTEISKLQS